MKNQLLSATDFVENVKNTVYIYRKLWRENTTALIHAPQSVDKTAKALEIAAEASASGRKIVYINAANTLHDHADAVRRISGLSIFNPRYESADDTSDYADIVIGRAEAEGRTIWLTSDLPRSFILADSRWGEPVVYLSPLSSDTLAMRAEQSDPLL